MFCSFEPIKSILFQLYLELVVPKSTIFAHLINFSHFKFLRRENNNLGKSNIRYTQKQDGGERTNGPLVV